MIQENQKRADLSYKEFCEKLKSKQKKNKQERKENLRQGGSLFIIKPINEL